MERCGWCKGDALYEAYHDKEWGLPEHDDKRLFEFLILEGAQAGLSWITVLRKREHYRKVMAGFDPEVLAGWGEAEVADALADSNIVRNRAKIEATLGNARAAIQLWAAGDSLAELLWSAGDEPEHVAPVSMRCSVTRDRPAASAVTVALSRSALRWVRICAPKA